MTKEQIIDYLKKFILEDEELREAGESYDYRYAAILGKLDFLVKNSECDVK